MIWRKRDTQYLESLRDQYLEKLKEFEGVKDKMEWEKKEKRMTPEEAVELVKSAEVEMQEKFQWISEASNDELIELLSMVNFDKSSSFNDQRFVNRLVIKSLQQLFMNVSPRQGYREEKEK